ncbi:MAG: CpsD/CapB family tyrosine-protein kinase [Clostridiales bacterium]|nr:CpsD/CapB family tyrosine-protein kinase [Clostridiales bacterium]
MEDKIRQDFDRLVLAVIPTLNGKDREQKGSQDGTLCGGLNFAATESYKLLRANISFCFPPGQECRVLGITSSVRGEGKSTTSINLAYVLAQTGSRVCLLDCDLRIPSVATKLRLHRKPGLTNLVMGQSGEDKSIQTYTYKDTSFCVITAGDIPPNPTELLGSSNMATVLEALKKRFQYIILDLSPVGVVSDPLSVCGLTDGMLFVVRENVYNRRLLSESLRMLDGAGVRLLGIVVTNSTMQEKEYRHYGSKYGESYGYADTGKENRSGTT